MICEDFMRILYYKVSENLILHIVVMSLIRLVFEWVDHTWWNIVTMLEL